MCVCVCVFHDLCTILSQEGKNPIYNEKICSVVKQAASSMYTKCRHLFQDTYFALISYICETIYHFNISMCSQFIHLSDFSASHIRNPARATAQFRNEHVIWEHLQDTQWCCCILLGGYLGDRKPGQTQPLSQTITWSWSIWCPQGNIKISCLEMPERPGMAKREWFICLVLSKQFKKAVFAHWSSEPKTKAVP